MNRPDDMPSAPASQPFFQQRDHGVELGLASARGPSMPITIRRSVLWPTSMPAFTAVAGNVSR